MEGREAPITRSAVSGSPMLMFFCWGLDEKTWGTPEPSAFRGSLTGFWTEGIGLLPAPVQTRVQTSAGLDFRTLPLAGELTWVTEDAFWKRGYAEEYMATQARVQKTGAQPGF